MLRNNIIDLAHDVVQVTELTTSLSPASKLSLAVAMSNDHTAMFESDINEFKAAIHNASRSCFDDDGASEHDAVLEDIIQAPIAAMSNAIRTVDEYIIPMITSLGERLVDMTDAYVSEGLSSSKVVYIEIPSVLAEMATTTLLDQMNAKVMIETDRNAATAIHTALWNLDFQNVQIHTGSAALDGYAKEYLASIPTDKTELYNWITTIFQDSKAPISTDASYLDRINNELGAILLAQALRETPPEGTRVNLDVYRKFMDGVAKSSAAVLSTFVNYVSGEINRGRLIARAARISPDAISVSIYKEAMLKAGEAHGVSADTVIGAALLGVNYNTMSIVARKEECDRFASRTANNIRMKRQDKSTRYACSELGKALLREIADMDDEHLPQTRADLNKAVLAKVDTTQKVDIGKIYDVVRDWVLEILYPAPAYRIVLEGRARARDRQSDLDSDEANYEALVDMVVDYLAAQFN